MSSQLPARRAATSVVGLDNLNDYYDPQLKRDRLARLHARPGFRFVQLDVADRAAMQALFAERQLRARRPPRGAGRRALLAAESARLRRQQRRRLPEHARRLPAQRRASTSSMRRSSSVYGGNTQMPFSEHHNVDHPVSLYAATKKANELMAHTYSHLFGLPTTGLRFFTVYGPWGRPDMALFLFTKAILEGRADRRLQPRPDGARLHLHRRHRRRRGARARPAGDGRSGDSIRRRARSGHAATRPTACLNIGNNQPVELMELHRGDRARRSAARRRRMLPLQPATCPPPMPTSPSWRAWTGFKPATSVREGVGRFVAWYRGYFGV